MRSLAVFVLGVLIGLWVRELAKEPGAYADGASDGKPDDDPLTEIAGIGPVFEQALHEIGILTFAQLARQDADALAALLEGRVNAERIRRERWIEQAQERARP